MGIEFRDRSNACPRLRSLLSAFFFRARPQKDIATVVELSNDFFTP